MTGQGSKEESNALLRSYLQTQSAEDSERLLEELLARVAPLIEKTLGRRFRVSITAGRSQNPDAEDQYSEVCLLLIDKLRRFRLSPGESPVRDFQSYVEAVAENAFRTQLRADYRELRSLKDGLRYLLSGRTKQKTFALWRSDTGQFVGGFAAWKAEGKAVTRTQTYQQLLDDPRGFAHTKFPRADFRGIGRAELLEAILRGVGGPVALDDLVKVVAFLQEVRTTITRSGSSGALEENYVDVIGEAPSDVSTPLETLQSKSDLQAIWEDLCRLSLEQRRVLLLQAQHDVIEILLRAGIARIQAIAALLEMTVEEVEELRCAGFLSDDRLGRRFGFLKATIMQQRHRARRRMAKWRERWGQ